MRSFKQFINEIGTFDPSRSDDDITHFNIVNTKNNQVVGKAKTKNGARRALDNHDNKYGAAVHKMVPVYKPKAEE